MGAQKAIAQEIIHGKAGYVLALRATTSRCTGRSSSTSTSDWSGTLRRPRN